MLPLWKVKKIKYYKITYIIRSQITYQWMDKKQVFKFALIIMREIIDTGRFQIRSLPVSIVSTISVFSRHVAPCRNHRIHSALKFRAIGE